MTDPDDLPGSLDQQRVHDWHHRLGTTNQLGSNRSRRLHRQGRSGADNYMPTFTLDADGDPADFDEYLFWRPLSLVVTYVLLRTPATMSRTSARIAERHSPYVLFGTTDALVHGHVIAGGREHSYARSNPLAALSMSQPFAVTNDSVAELSSVWVPAEMVDADDLAGSDPVIADSPLSRATAVFLRNFAHDVAVRGADVDVDTEMAAIDLLRSTLNPHRARTISALDSPTILRERVSEVIDRNYRDPAFDADTLAAMLHLSRRQLYRRLSDFDESPAEMIAQRRLDKAHELLSCTGTFGLKAVARASGFSSVATLRNRFAARYGMTPVEFRHQTGFRHQADSDDN
ncbi:helix-turn-helix domain-containing protein [Gordonia aichiensis]